MRFFGNAVEVVSGRGLITIHAAAMSEDKYVSSLWEGTRILSLSRPLTGRDRNKTKGLTFAPQTP
jgi:hypothetical protein